MKKQVIKLKISRSSSANDDFTIAVRTNSSAAYLNFGDIGVLEAIVESGNLFLNMIKEHAKRGNIGGVPFSTETALSLYQLKKAKQKYQKRIKQMSKYTRIPPAMREKKPSTSTNEIRAI